MKEFAVRQALPEEIMETVKIYVESHHVDFPFLPSSWQNKDPQVEYQECVEWLEAAPFNRILAAMVGDRMAGYIAVPKNSVDPMEYDAEINGFFVRQAFRSQGVGLRLLEAAGRYLKEGGCERVLLYTLRRGESDQFYRRMGGSLLREVSQRFSGQTEVVDIFGWEIDELLRTVEQKMNKHSGSEGN